MNRCSIWTGRSVSVLIPPSKNALARSCKKRSFFLHLCKILQDLARSCGILWDFAGILQDCCTKFLQDSCKFPQDPARSHRILQDLVRSCRGARKKDFSCKILQERFYWVWLQPFKSYDLFPESCTKKGK